MGHLPHVERRVLAGRARAPGRSPSPSPSPGPDRNPSPNPNPSPSPSPSPSLSVAGELALQRIGAEPEVESLAMSIPRPEGQSRPSG
eukprot:scaffold71421_cov55-Phaeocystis_antarctica.AAC.3